MATEHLLSLGHRRIGVICGHTAHNDRARSRIEGVRQTLKRAGLKLMQSRRTERALNINGGRASLRVLVPMATTRRPTAILCGNDRLATGELLEAQRIGIHVPRQLSICGIDNHELAGADSTKDSTPAASGCRNTVPMD